MPPTLARRWLSGTIHYSLCFSLLDEVFFNIHLTCFRRFFNNHRILISKKIPQQYFLKNNINKWNPDWIGRSEIKRNQTFIYLFIYLHISKKGGQRAMPLLCTSHTKQWVIPITYDSDEWLLFTFLSCDWSLIGCKATNFSICGPFCCLLHGECTFNPPSSLPWEERTMLELFGLLFLRIFI